MLYGILTVVCEGRFFEWLGDAMGDTQKVVLKQTTSALGVTAVLHNVIMVFLGTIMPRYVTQLGRKNFWHKLRSVRVFGKNCARNFFRSVGKGVAIEN